MKSDEIRKHIEGIEAELAALPQSSDSEIEAQAAAGADVETLVAEDTARAQRRRVLSIQASALSKELSAAIKAEAQPNIDKALKHRATAIQTAGRALGDAQASIDIFKRAIEQWEAAAADAATEARQANATARQAGITPPIADFQIGIGSGEFVKMDRRIATILRPHRRDGSQLNKQQVEPLETY